MNQKSGQNSLGLDNCFEDEANPVDLFKNSSLFFICFDWEEAQADILLPYFLELKYLSASSFSTTETFPVTLTCLLKLFQ